MLQASGIVSPVRMSRLQHGNFVDNRIYGTKLHETREIDRYWNFVALTGKTERGNVRWVYSIE